LLGEWLQNLAWRMREKNKTRFVAKMPPFEFLASERRWRRTEIQDEWLTPVVRTGLEKQAEYCVRILQPSVLLINMCGRFTSYALKPQYQREGVMGGYGDYGGGNPDIGFEYNPLRWEQLCAAAYQYFERHPGIVAARKRLKKVGIRTHWASVQYNAASEFNIYYMLDENSVAAIRVLAKEDWGVKNKTQSDAFDRVFDLYLKQNWGAEAERKMWRERERLAGWPTAG
jgi:hypothetical protein